MLEDNSACMSVQARVLPFILAPAGEVVHEASY